MQMPTQCVLMFADYLQHLHKVKDYWMFLKLSVKFKCVQEINLNLRAAGLPTPVCTKRHFLPQTSLIRIEIFTYNS